MKIKPATLANIVPATPLLASIFLVRAIPSSVAEYDAWEDLNDDGTVNIFDIVTIAISYGEEYTP